MPLRLISQLIGQSECDSELGYSAIQYQVSFQKVVSLLVSQVDFDEPMYLIITHSST